MGLVVPTRTGGGGRRYTMRNVAQLREIARLSAEGVSLEGIKRVLELENQNAELKQRVRDLEAAHARRMAETMIAEAPRSLEQEVEEAILLQLPEGGANLAVTARALGLHPRTLQRRLEAAGHPFAAMLDAVRRRQASRHLANPRLSLTEVAELTGYASLSAFTRWHAQVFGVPPRLARAGSGSFAKSPGKSTLPPPSP
jgi:AraC-like DNA-binding protein